MTKELTEFTMEAYNKKYASQALGQRGKTLERDFRKALDAVKAKVLGFDFERIPDARSSMGAMRTPRTGDFLIFYKGTTTVVEAKEVKHDFRLGTTAFPPDERGRLNRRALAGCRVMVLVMHSTNDTYRWLPISSFDNRTNGSWDLSGFSVTTLKDIVNDITNNQ